MASRPTRLHIDGQRDAFRKCASQKVGYATFDEALSGAEWLMEQGRVDPGCHITPYPCADCGEWHVANRRVVWRPIDLP